MDIKSNEIKVVIYWLTKNAEAIKLIRERFGITTYTTLNGHTPALLHHDQMPLFEETSRRGYFSFRYVDWTFNGATYSW